MSECNTRGSKKGNGLSQSFRVTKRDLLQCGLPSPSLGNTCSRTLLSPPGKPKGHRLRTVWVGDSGRAEAWLALPSAVVYYHAAFPTRHSVWGESWVEMESSVGSKKWVHFCFVQSKLCHRTRNLPSTLPAILSLLVTPVKTNSSVELPTR